MTTANSNLPPDVDLELAKSLDYSALTDAEIDKLWVETVSTASTALQEYRLAHRSNNVSMKSRLHRQYYTELAKVHALQLIMVSRGLEGYKLAKWEQINE